MRQTWLRGISGTMIVAENGPTDPEFLRLANRARGGDKAALGELLQKYHRLMLAMANEALSPEMKVKDGASDIVQEAKINALTSFQQFDGTNQAALKNWLLTIVHNVIRDKHRFNRRDKRDYRLEQPLNGIQDDSQNKQLKADDPSPSSFVSSKEDLARFEQALLELPAPERQVVELRYRQYFSFPEIAKQLAITSDVVNYRWFKALNLIREKVCPNNERPNPA